MLYSVYFDQSCRIFCIQMRQPVSRIGVGHYQMEAYGLLQAVEISWHRAKAG